ncbi:MAG TPA: TldD/PmbA family protein [Cyclobacteriaceae bacterium]|jgi:TldD protein|nr:TldD/PmbA family protein [Cytophagales bacterium]HNT49771.1 TldD/PmbA family protein [Cyclobacteriaceae bacterium]HRE66470.1 TldD/PmbA family protein [Cyclobacteriaceae bacterium]HRF31997.1 TldD/PmbA family protein [Cyclobacteriaceae bacterium]
MRKILFVLMMACATVASAQDVLLDVLKEELNREVKEFTKTETPPYYLAYRVNDVSYTRIESSFGSLVQSYSNRNRLLLTTVRVGDYAFDNTHPAENGQWDGDEGGGNAIQIPVDDSREAIQYSIWRVTQNSYKQARETLKALKNSPASSKNKLEDFSKATPEQFVEPPLPANWFKLDEWQDKVRRYSVPFQKNADMVSGDVSLQLVSERKYFVSSEGTNVVQNQRYVYLMINGNIRAKDGDIVPLHKSFFAFSPEGLPTDEVVLQEVDKLINILSKLKDAPLAEPYSGPAILDAQVAGVFFHEIFGHRVEGERLRNDMDSQTFKEKIGQPVLNKNLSVIFDPTLKEFQGKPLNGFYRYDDEGVKGQRVVVVDNGILKTFLMSRTPLESVKTSNGHGRADASSDPVSRQSNLIVEAAKPVSFQDLRKMLIQEAKKQGKPYGYYFKDVVGGFTTTDRFNPNAFNIFPTEVYRVYVNGKPDELVRGVDLIGTPLAMFAEITSADKQSAIFTGFCGAESGSVPVTAISPSLFVRRIETQKKPQTDIESTVLKTPTLNEY